MSRAGSPEDGRSADAVVQAAIRARTLAQVQERGALLVAQYRRRFGRVLNADKASELFDEYTRSRCMRLHFLLPVTLLCALGAGLFAQSVPDVKLPDARDDHPPDGNRPARWA